LRSIARPVLVALLSAGLLNISTMAAAGKPLGMVVNAENAHLSYVNATMGTNVFAGDYLETDPGGTLRIKIGANQVYLSSASSAILMEDQNKSGVKLTHGTVGFSSPASAHFEIVTPVGTVRAADGKPAFGEVTLISPQKILVAAYHGSVVVSNGTTERTIAEGDAYNVSLAQAPQGSGTGNDDNNGNGNGNSNGNQKGGGYAIHNAEPLIFTAVVAGIMAGVGYAIWRVADESDSTPPSN
jgi:hypothetical protein